jgi:beta-lactam-binding protein with PASTA domain
MAKTFSITTTAVKTQKADSNGHAQVEFDVTNTSARPARGLAKAKALDTTKQEWLKLQGDDERDFAPGTSQKFIVDFDGPVISPETSAAPKPAVAQASTEPVAAPTYGFRLDVAAATNPDEDFTESPVVQVEAAVGKATKKFPYWIIPVAAVVLIGIGVGLWLFLRNPTVEVPAVVGMEVAEAKATLENSGLKATEATNAETGKVTAQSPQAGEKVAKNAEVALTVEEPEALVEVPEVVKQLVSDATQKLTDAGFTVVATGTEIVEGLQPNQVVSQKPGGGEKAALGSPVELTVAAERLVEVPDVRFNPIAIAREKLQAAGLKSDEQTPELADASVPPGSVKSQNPAAGAKVPANSAVTLVVADTPTQVPSIVGRRVAEAQLLLQRQQLEMVVFGSFNESNAATVLVQSQTPAAGTNVAKGSKVTARVPCLRLDCRFVLFDRVSAVDRVNTVQKVDPARIQSVGTFRVRKVVPVSP